MTIEPHNQPEIHIQDGIFTKLMPFAKAGDFTEQHRHEYDHLTIVAWGAVVVWQDNEFKGWYRAPTGIPVPAGVDHKFMSLMDDTLLLCIHRTDRFEPPEAAGEPLKE